jgi:hypothetical protein
VTGRTGRCRGDSERPFAVSAHRGSDECDPRISENLGEGRGGQSRSWKREMNGPGARIRAVDLEIQMRSKDRGDGLTNLGRARGRGEGRGGAEVSDAGGAVPPLRAVGRGVGNGIGAPQGSGGFQF